ncbi:hypothetical protein ACI2LC_34640 [Nonomuraea wenchangensis]|uniref:Excreted virulence factor EspC, type VII ESX diderm n=1 Tax=Nonomuraea wenchangensis TaxID=568860 RepID=A0A1I0LBI1_9ACTN|nr:hypothetical protein [Nonomuraea wenchangensis]SEU36866.1 hypothetical protein SAMN05421811_11423 [Nonomuraea wenchangensis]
MGETQPPKNWPGLEAERDGVTYDAKKIASIAEALREAMKPMGGGNYGEYPGSIHDLSLNGSLKAESDHLRSVGRWQAGESFADTLDQAHREFLNVYEEALNNLSVAIALVNAGAGNYKITNAANEGGG